MNRGITLTTRRGYVVTVAPNLATAPNKNTYLGMNYEKEALEEFTVPFQENINVRGQVTGSRCKYYPDSRNILEQSISLQNFVPPKPSHLLNHPSY